MTGLRLQTNWLHNLFIRFLVFTMVVGGFIVDAESESLSFTLVAPPYRQSEAEAIAEQLEDLGITVAVEIKEKTLLRSEASKGNLTAYLTDWGSAYFDPFDLAEPKITTDGRGNFSFYSNTEVDELLEVASSSTDLVARTSTYHQIQNIIYRDALWVFGYLLMNIEGVATSVVDYTPSMDTRINLHDVELKRGDTLVVGMNTDSFHALDPSAYRSRETETMIRNMFDGLVTRTLDGKVVPELAESWQQVDDYAYIFTIKNGPKFHNGDPVTVEDVVFTFERVLEPNAINGVSSQRKNLLGPLVKVEAVTQSQVRFVLAKPFPVFLQALVHFQIVPKRYIQKVGDKVFGENPIGAGPFKFVRGELGTEIVMERFPDYYGGSPMLPPVWPAKIDRAVFRTMPEPFNRVAALLAGEVHIIQAVPTDLIGWLAKSKSARILTAEGTRSFQIELNNEKTPFNDIRIRKAINYAIDWDSVLTNVYNGYGQRLATCFLPSGYGYNPDLKPYPHDIDTAKKLLQEAGYEVK